MNKIVLVVCLLMLALSGVNTALLVQMGGHMKESGEKMKAVSKSLEAVQPILQDLSEKRALLPTDKPPIDLPKPPGETDNSRDKRPGADDADPDLKPKLPPKPPLPFPPGLPPKP